MKRFDDVSQYYGGCEGPLGFPMKDAVAHAVEGIIKSLDTDCRSFLESHRAKAADGTALNVCRVGKAAEGLEFSDAALRDISFITTEAVDLDGEVLFADGGAWTYFERNGKQVTWCHQYTELPVGNCLWLKQFEHLGHEGWKAATEYHAQPDWFEGNWFPRIVYHYVAHCDLKGKSIGFVPLAVRKPTAKDIQARPWLDGVDLIIPQWIGLEYAVAPIQCNPDTVVTWVQKAALDGIETPELMLKSFGVTAEQLKAAVAPPAALVRAAAAAAAKATEAHRKELVARDRTIAELQEKLKAKAQEPPPPPAPPVITRAERRKQIKDLVAEVTRQLRGQARDALDVKRGRV